MNRKRARENPLEDDPEVSPNNNAKKPKTNETEPDHLNFSIEGLDDDALFEALDSAIEKHKGAMMK